MTRWLFVLVLAANLAYFGWEFNRQLGRHAAGGARSEPAPESGSITLLEELPRYPPLREESLEPVSPELSAAAAEAGKAGPEAAAGAPRSVESVTGPPPEADVEPVEPSAGPEAFDLAQSAMPPDASAPQAEMAGPAPPVEAMGSAMPPEMAGPAPQADVAAGGATPQAALAPPPPDTCIEVGPLRSLAEADKRKLWFEARRKSVSVRAQEVIVRQRFWVYLEPLASRSDAERRVDELRRRGVEDYMLVRGGEMNNAISLGLFSSQSAVNKRLAELEDRGYRALVIPRTDTRTEYWLEVNLGPVMDFQAADFARFGAEIPDVKRVSCEGQANSSAPAAP